MEVWWTGSHTRPGQGLLALAVAFVPVLLLHRTQDFRTTRDLWLVDAAVGTVVYEAVPFSIGAGVATHFFRRSRDEPGTGSPPEGGLDVTLADLGATAIGAVLVSLNIAPTDEVPMLTAVMGPRWLLVLVALSLLVSYGIVSVAGFGGQEQRHATEGVLQHPITETVACYVVALVSSTAMLWFFQQADGPLQLAVSQTDVLGSPQRSAVPPEGWRCEGPCRAERGGVDHVRDLLRDCARCRRASRSPAPRLGQAAAPAAEQNGAGAAGTRPFLRSRRGEEPWRSHRGRRAGAGGAHD